MTVFKFVYGPIRTENVVRNGVEREFLFPIKVLFDTNSHYIVSV